MLHCTLYGHCRVHAMWRAMWNVICRTAATSARCMPRDVCITAAPLYVCGTPVVSMLYARCMYAVRPLYVCCMPVVCMRCACMYVVCPLYVCGAPAAPLRLRVVRVLGPLHVHGRGVRLDAEGPLAVLHSLLQQPSPGADVAAASPIPEQMRAGLSLPCHDLWFVQSEHVAAPHVMRRAA